MLMNQNVLTLSLPTLTFQKSRPSFTCLSTCIYAVKHERYTENIGTSTRDADIRALNLYEARHPTPFIDKIQSTSCRPLRA